jgi:hypothetical protein
MAVIGSASSTRRRGCSHATFRRAWDGDGIVSYAQLLEQPVAGGMAFGSGMAFC